MWLPNSLSFFFVNFAKKSCLPLLIFFLFFSNSYRLCVWTVLLNCFFCLIFCIGSFFLFILSLNQDPFKNWTMSNIILLFQAIISGDWGHSLNHQIQMFRKIVPNPSPFNEIFRRYIVPVPGQRSWCVNANIPSFFMACCQTELILNEKKTCQNCSNQQVHALHRHHHR